MLQRNFGGHTYPRLAHVGDRTGLEMIRTLQDKGVHSGIEVHQEVTIRAILKDGDRVSGCFGYQRESGRFVVYKTKAVVLEVTMPRTVANACQGARFALSFSARATRP